MSRVRLTLSSGRVLEREIDDDWVTQWYLDGEPITPDEAKSLLAELQVACHPDLAELNVMLDGFYDSPPAVTPPQ
ncbi:hypothetical protein [Streptomyces anulatus]|uniref:hypothetical protein n=1 Tax=Streptomyces anulatus TaxID=1892 RepID=UPI002E136D90|nr:hypothetical protein OG557_13610 [Streptomyces anulatus]